MKAAVIRSYGAPDVLSLADYDDPSVKEGEVLVRVAAAGVNPIDAIERSGGMKEHRPMKFPSIIGWDLAGTVVEIGPGVSSFAVGDRVMAWAYHTYAELCTVKTELLAKLPDGMELADAAALPLVTLTGGQLISVASGLQRGQSVLVSGAVGSVGRVAVFMAKELGARVIAGVTRKQVAQAESLGADAVVALDDAGALEQLDQVDVVANTVRGVTASRLMGKVRPNGMFASVTGVPEEASNYPSVRKEAFVSKQDAGMLARMGEAVRAGGLTIPIGLRLPLREANAAHVAMEKGGAGKILLLP